MPKPRYREPVCNACGVAIEHKVKTDNWREVRPFLTDGGAYLWFNDNGVIGWYADPFDMRDIPYCAKCREVFAALDTLRA